MAHSLSEAQLVAALQALGTYNITKKVVAGKGTVPLAPPAPPVPPTMSLFSGAATGTSASAPSTSAPASSAPTTSTPATSVPTSIPPFTPITSTGLGASGFALPPIGLGRGAILKKSISTPVPHTPALSHDMTQYHVSAPPAPKISFFSGDDQKGDITYNEWRFEVRCLVHDPDITHSVLVQAIRRSLRGTARTMLVSLGEFASCDQILAKLDSLFGDVSTNGMIMQEFFNSNQKSDESVTSFGCRLEGLLQLAIQHGNLPPEDKNDLLRHKFWTSLSSDKLKSQTRHKYDSLTNYDDLLREIRMVEKEMSVGHSGPQVSKKAVHQPMFVDDQIREVERRVDQKLESLERRIDSKLDDKFNLILNKLDDRSGSSEFKPQGDRQGGHGSGKPFYNKKRYHNNNNNNKQQPQQQQQQHQQQQQDPSRGNGGGKPQNNALNG